MPTPGRAGQPHHVGVAGQRGERRHHLAQLRGRPLHQGDQPGHGPRPALPRLLDQRGDVHASQLRLGDLARLDRSAVGSDSPGSGRRAPGRSARRPGRRRRTAPPRPMPPPRRFSSSARCSTSRAPDIPIGWPSAIAPPLTFTFSGVTPRSFMDWTATAANASLISIRSRSPTVRPVLPQRVVDRVGRLRLQRVVRARHVAVGADLGDPLQAELLAPSPCSSRRRPRHRRRSARRCRR